MKSKTFNQNEILVGALSDIGKIREENQDNFLVLTPDNPTRTLAVLVVADGMGGHKGGATASRMVVDCVQRIFSHTKDEDDINQDGNRLLESVIQTANTEVYQGGFSPDHMGMGTTVTIIQLKDNGEYTIGHVGDSRAYLIRDGNIKRISTDHSLVGDLVATKKITEEEARVHPERNVITKAVGLKDKVEPQIENGRIERGDIFVLCSDGLHGLVGDSEILRIASTEHPKTAVSNLVRIANDEAGHDNITVIVAKIGIFKLDEEKNPDNGLSFISRLRTLPTRFRGRK